MGEVKEKKNSKYLPRLDKPRPELDLPAVLREPEPANVAVAVEHVRVALAAALEARRPVAVERAAEECRRDLALDEGDGAVVVVVLVALPLGDLVVEFLELGVEGRGPVRDGIARGLRVENGFGEVFFFFFDCGERERRRKGSRKKRKREVMEKTSVIAPVLFYFRLP